MTYYLYRRHDGAPEVSEYELPLAIFPGYTLLSSSEEKPDLSSQKLDDKGVLDHDLDALKTVKKLAIERQRDRKLVDPIIVYDGVNLDADAQAQSNLSDKLAAVNCRIARNTPTPVEMLVWKDYDNVIHSFADINSYKDWLDGFAIALEERGTAVWAWSWQKKTALDALTTVDAINSFDVMT